MINAKSSMLWCLGLAIFSSQMAFLKPEHSELHTKAELRPDKKVLELEFRVTPKDGIKVTDEGPWQLSLTETDGLTLPLKDGKFTLDSKQFDKSIPGFKLEVKELTKAGGTMTYKLKAFVCTLDKTRCFPEIHKGTLSWGAK